MKPYSSRRSSRESPRRKFGAFERTSHLVRTGRISLSTAFWLAAGLVLAGGTLVHASKKWRSTPGIIVHNDDGGGGGGDDGAWQAGPPIDLQVLVPTGGTAYISPGETINMQVSATDFDIDPDGHQQPDILHYHWSTGQQGPVARFKGTQEGTFTFTVTASDAGTTHYHDDDATADITVVVLPKTWTKGSDITATLAPNSTEVFPGDPVGFSVVAHDSDLWTSGALGPIEETDTALKPEWGDGMLPKPGDQWQATWRAPATAQDVDIAITVNNNASTKFVDDPVTKHATVKVVDYNLSMSTADVALPPTGTGQATVNINGLNQFSGTVSLAAFNLPSGVSATFAPTNVTGTGTSAVTFDSAGATPGRYTVLIKGTCGSHERTTSLTISVGDFAVVADPVQVSLVPGETRSTTISVNPLGYIKDVVTLGATGLPTGVTAAFSPVAVQLNGETGGTSKLTFTASAAVAPGSYTVTVTGNGQATSHTTSVVVEVSNFSIVVNPSSLKAPVGQSRNVTVTVAGTPGYSGTVNLTAETSDPAISTSFTPASVTITDGGTTTSTLRLGSATTAGPGTYSVTVTGTDGDGYKSIAGVRYGVTDFGLSSGGDLEVALHGDAAGTVQLVPYNGYDSTVGLTSQVQDIAGQASDALNVTLAPAQVSAGNPTSFLSVTPSATAASGEYKIVVTGTDPSGAPMHSVTIGVKVKAFFVHVAASDINVPVGQTKTLGVTVEAAAGFTGQLALVAQNAPAGVTATLNPATLTGAGTSTLTLAAGPDAQAGVYKMLIEGTSNGVSDSAAFTLFVSDFRLNASPTTLSMPPGGAKDVSVQVDALAGFPDDVVLTATTPVTGITASFAPATVTGGGTSTMTVNAQHGVSPGKYTITITGTDPQGSPVHTTTVDVLVANFTVNVDPDSLKMLVGTSATTTATLIPLNGFHGDVALTAEEVPSGVTIDPSPASVSLEDADPSTSELTVNVDESARAGSYPITIVATDADGNASLCTLKLDVTDFSLDAEPMQLYIYAGQDDVSSISLYPEGKFDDEVTLRVQDPPAGIVADFDQSTIVPGQSAVLTVSVPANTPEGDYDLTVVGTDGHLERTTIVTISVLQAKVWTPGDQIQGGSFIGPDPDTKVAPGSDTTVSVEQATDFDHWTAGDGSEGDAQDGVNYLWTVSGGTYDVDPTSDGSRIIWHAPLDPGTYTITCKVDDDGPEVFDPDTGSRNDDDLPEHTATTTITVDKGLTHFDWSAPTDIVRGTLGGVSPGDELATDSVTVLYVDKASDQDHWKIKDAEGNVLTEGDLPDGLTYNWTCSSGQFIVGHDENDQPIYDSTAQTAVVQWKAPATVPESGSVTFSVTVDDLAPLVVSPDTGSRNDNAPDPLTVTAHVVASQEQGIEKLVYSVASDTNGSPIWQDVPQEGSPNYPLTVNQGDNVSFQAIATHPDLPWPHGTPLWAGEGIDGSIGETEDVVFTHASTNDTDFKVVSATCNNKVSANVKVRRSYQLTVTSTKPHILAAGYSDLSSTDIKVTLMDYDKNPVPNMPVHLTSKYRSDDINQGVSNSDAGALDDTNLSTDAQGTAHTVLRSPGNNVALGTAVIQAAVMVDLSPLTTSPAEVELAAPDASADTGKEWVSAADGKESELPITITFDGKPVADRIISVEITGIFEDDDDGQHRVDNINPTSWVYFREGTGMMAAKTDSKGQIIPHLVWIRPDDDPHDYSIGLKVIDNATYGVGHDDN